MSIDERLAFLLQSTESLHASAQELHATAAEHTKQLAKSTEQLQIDAENIRRLATIAAAHKHRRLDNIEGNNT